MKEEERKKEGKKKSEGGKVKKVRGRKGYSRVVWLDTIAVL